MKKDCSHEEYYYTPTNCQVFGHCQILVVHTNREKSLKEVGEDKQLVEVASGARKGEHVLVTNEYLKHCEKM